MANRDFSDDDSLIISAIRNPTKAVQLAGESFRRNIKEIADKQFPLPFEPNQIDLVNRKINWRPGQKEKLANDSVSFAAGNSPAMLLTFIGKGAKTWDEKAAKKAAALLSRGVDPEKVWQRHMTGQMPDGALFQEIDDSGAMVGNVFMKDKPISWLAKDLMHKNPERPSLNIANLMSHDKLYQAYPELANTSVNFKGDLGGSMSMPSLGRTNYQMDLGELEKGASVPLHELQHAIQDREGWARGGSPSNMKMEDWSDSFRKDYSDIESQIENARQTKKTSVIFPLMNKTNVTALKANRDAYSRLAGEAQARATQERMGMDMAERRANYPLKNNKLADVLLSDLIYKYGDNGKEMSVGLPETEFSKAHALAQKNAALPIEQGGLGLHPDNTAMERARALGFDTNAYTGTNISDEIESMMPKSWFSEQPGYASDYSSVLKKNGIQREPRVYPVMLKTGKVNSRKYTGLYDDMEKALSKKKTNTFKVEEVGGGSNNFYVPKESNQIRSRFAAFDPLKKNSANILAGAALGSTLLEKDKKRKDK